MEPQNFILQENDGKGKMVCILILSPFFIFHFIFVLFPPPKSYSFFLPPQFCFYFLFIYFFFEKRKKKNSGHFKLWAFRSMSLDIHPICYRAMRSKGAGRVKSSKAISWNICLYLFIAFFCSAIFLSLLLSMFMCIYVFMILFFKLYIIRFVM